MNLPKLLSIMVIFLVILLNQAYSSENTFFSVMQSMERGISGSNLPTESSLKSMTTEELESIIRREREESRFILKNVTEISNKLNNKNYSDTSSLNQLRYMRTNYILNRGRIINIYKIELESRK